MHTLIIHCMLTVLLPCFHQATKDGRTLLSLVMCTKTKRRASMTIRVHMPTQVCSFVNRSTHIYTDYFIHRIEDSTHTHQIFCSFFCNIFVYANQSKLEELTSKDAVGGVGELSKRVVSGEYHSTLFVVHILIEPELLSSDGLSLFFSAFSRVLVMCVYDMLCYLLSQQLWQAKLLLGSWSR